MLATKYKDISTWSLVLWNGLGGVIAALVCPLVGLEMTLISLNFEGMLTLKALKIIRYLTGTLQSLRGTYWPCLERL